MNPRAHDWVAAHALRRPDAPALTGHETGETFTWGELDARVASLAHRFVTAYGLRRGDRVALVAENDPRMIEVQFACHRAGLAVVPLNWRSAPAELDAVLADAEPGLIVHDVEWAGLAGELADRAGLAHRLGWGTPSSEYEAAVTGPDGVPGTAGDPADLAQVMYTSGTTGRPKGVMVARDQLTWQAINLGHTCRMGGFDNSTGIHHLNVVPWFHAGGLNVFTNPTLYWGGHVTTTRRFDPAETLRLLTSADAGLTHFCGVLQIYEWLTERPEFATASFPTLRCALFGGWGPSFKGIHRAWRERGLAPTLAYGSTELGPLVCTLDGADVDAVDAGSSGIAVPHVSLRLVRADGTDADVDEPGELWASGPVVTLGYWGIPAEQTFTDGWLRTGDVMRRDAAGHHYVVGRLHEVYRSGGENVYPLEVEAVVSELPAVAEVAVIAVPDERFGEVGLAVVVLTEGAQLTLDELTGHLRDRLARFKHPRDLRIVDELPRNVTGKISRAALRERFGGVSLS